MPDRPMPAGSSTPAARATQPPDWVGSTRTFVIAWGLPVAALAAAAGLAHPLKTMVWIGALTWMGVACLVNAGRCGRIHCFYTGPYFLLIAVMAFLHGFQILWLGDAGWRWLAAAMGVGGGLLWCVPEYLQGKYRRPAAVQEDESFESDRPGTR